MGPAALNRRWAFSGPWMALLVEGGPHELFGAGQTTWLPVYGEGGKRLTVFAQLQPDPKDPQLLHFLYRFSAEQPVSLNSAYLELRLPQKLYAGEKLETIAGPTCQPALTVEPPAKGVQLANGSAGGVAVAAETAHGFRLEVEPARWICVNDERTWNKSNEHYTIQTCAIVTPAGTTLTPGQSAEVKGTIRFNAPVKVWEPPVLASPATTPATAGLRLEFSRGWVVRWFDAANLGAVATHLTMRGRQGDACLPRVGSTATTTDPPGVTATGKLWWDEAAGAGFDFSQQATAKPGEMTLQARLTARAAFACDGVALDTWLLGKYAEGCEAVFVGVPGGHSPRVVLRPDRDRVACALATGLRLEAGGQTVFELSGTSPTVWEIFAAGDGYVVSEWLLGYYTDPARLAAGGVTETGLTCRWGPK